MPAVPSVSPATGIPTNSYYIHTLDCNFVDNAGRTLLLRGVNLSGSSKAPVDQPSYVLEDFWDAAENGGKSFIGRPLNIEDGSADVHLARLRGWGYNMLRFPVTWEALEHEGPGKYDYEFMDYTVRVLRKCKEYGFKVFMDPHQDVWSRFSGGSGAPFWTLPACGINPRNITSTQAAIIHSEYPTSSNPDPGSLPAMVWSTNYGRLLSQTLFTLFFAGRDFAPKCIIDGKNIQDYLQEHYIEAMGQLADRIREAGDLIDECIIGWDSMNEPAEGLCGWDDLNVNPTKQGSTLKKGSAPTPAQSFRLGMGLVQTVDNWNFGSFGPSRSGTVTIDPKGDKLWAEPSIEDTNGVHPKWGWKRDPGWKLGTCIWAQHGVWDLETAEVVRPDYFRYIPSDTLGSDPTATIASDEFVAHYWLAHWRRFTKRIRASHPESIMFIQPPVFAPPPRIDEFDSNGDDEIGLRGRCAFSGHYYDGLTLITRHWNWFNADALGVIRGKYSSPVLAAKFGERAIRKSLQEQLGILKNDALTLGPYPTIIGEIGTPFDMDGKRSYGWTDGGKFKGDYSRQERALDASLNGADGPNAINYTIWTYCPDSSHRWGDGWNMEDLSLWSADDIDSTGRRILSGPGAGIGGGAVGLSKRGQGDDEGSMYGMGRDDSQAVLLRRNMGAPVLSAPSALSSLSTFHNPSDAWNDVILRWRSNPYDFLTEGARAVRAFARPFPTKVVGKALDVQFDIKSTEFKLTVLVRAEDKLNVRGVAEAEEEEKDKGGLATEVYIPLVQYAHPRLLAPSRAEMGDTQTVTEDPDDRTAPTPSSSLDLSGSSTPTITNPGLRWAGFTEQADVLDIDVSVSAGRWEVYGQTLKWWYDVPREGEADREYVLEVKRPGGVIKSKAESEEENKSWIEQLCPDDVECCVM
ncbi:glycoside hydrolase family 5 protein [Collybiopsis luxurians FD-317 M1]|uniref:Glycoside hydrolase family 5 protein n=1 Tax=Collybiopsis luxurians FD-317 M1 TaxID=944289 RepID=A0A0D0CTT5_9AGAR|nr:glycoside hydrolase family 5 protein [Collybiopsis luxurians FD-317 M1]